MGRFRHLVLVMVALGAAFGGTTASAADTVVGFEDQAAGTAIGAQYSALGVQLDPPSSLTVATGGPGVPPVAPHAGTKLLRATDHTCAPGTFVTFTGLFSSPRTTVGIWVHDPFTSDPDAHDVTLQAFNAAGASVGLTSASITSGLGWQQLLLIAVPGTTFDHFTVFAGSGLCDMLFDDLSFDPPAGGALPAVTWEGAATTPVSVERGAATPTTLTLRRTGGSTGRVNLTVVPASLPTGVTATVSPVQANGSDLRSPVIVTLTGAANAPPAGPVAVTLRATAVDSTAGTGTVDTTFPVVVRPPFVSLELAGPAPTLYRSDVQTVAATLTRHSLSTGLVTLTATGPAGVTLTVTPATVNGSAATTPISIGVKVDTFADRAPAGAITLTATTADPAAAPPATPAQLVIAAPVRVPELKVSLVRPFHLVLRAGAGVSRVDADMEAIDLPPGTIVTSGLEDAPTDIDIDASPTTWNSSTGTVLFKANLNARTGIAKSSTGIATVFARAVVPGHGNVFDRSFVELTVVPTIRYALAARGIEVTQGTQAIGPTVCSSIPTRNLGHIDSSVPYTGVRLVERDLTVARVYVSAWMLTNAKSLPNVGVRLHGFRGGREIAGSPLSPSAAPAGITPGDLDCVTTDDRTKPANVYTYVLPPAWTYGSVTLQAEILPISPTSTGSVLDECGSLFCQTFKRFTLRSIGFNRIRWPGIMPIRVTAKGVGPGSADAALYPARMISPGEPYLFSYQGDVDISSLMDLADFAATSPPFASLSRRDIVEGGAAQEVQFWARVLPGRSIVTGIVPPVDGIAGVANGRTIADLPASNGFSPRPSMIATTSRPLTSITHELSHILGRRHAGQNCNGTRPGDDQEGEQWLPDDQGFLQGVGLDLWGIAKSPGFTASAATPYRVIARNLPGSAAEFFDFMSYCAATDEVPSATNFPNTWLSPRGWNAEVASLEAWTKKTGGAIGVAPQLATATTPVLTVGAIGRGAVAAILTVRPAIGSAAPAGTTGPVLVGYGAAGTEVTRAAVTDEVLDETGLHSYTGSVLAQGVVRVAIVDQGGASLGDRAQSLHAPTVVVTSPRAGSTVGGSKAVRVAWTAADADGDKLAATVDTSADGGRTWRLIYQGSGSSTTLPAAYFAAATNARIRITVNDGFRTAVAVSGRFRALRAPASVHIDSPQAGARFDSDGSMSLIGSATTLAGPVASGKLVWRLDGRQIARGAKVAVRNLPPGRRVLTLGVTGDPKAIARETVVIRAVTPPFLKVTLPTRVGRSARFVSVRLKSGTKATIRVAGKRVTIKARKTVTLRVPVKPGRGEAVLVFTAHALGADYSFTRVVRRP